MLSRQLATMAVLLATVPRPASAMGEPIVPWPDDGAGSLCERLFSVTGTTPRWLRLERQVLRFWEMGPTESSGGDDEPIVFVHGYVGSLCDFGPVLPAAAREHRVIAFDLPGFGESVDEQDEPSVDGYVRLIGKLVARLGVRRAHLVCHSMGGQICIGVGLTSPSYVASLTLIDTAGVYERATFLGGISKRVVGLNIGAMLAEKGRTMLDVVESNRVVLRHLAFQNPAIWAAMSSFQTSFRADIGRLAVPVLVIWGHDDPVFPLDSACLLKENIAGSTLYVIDDAGHSPQLSHPAETWRVIERFTRPAHEGSPSEVP